MITRKEYNAALDVIEAYHKQLFSEGVRRSSDDNRQTVDDWVNSFGWLPTRMRNVVTYCQPDYSTGECERVFNYMDEITKMQFLNIRNAGIKAWSDFVSCRDGTHAACKPE